MTDDNMIIEQSKAGLTLSKICNKIATRYPSYNNKHRGGVSHVQSKRIYQTLEYEF